MMWWMVGRLTESNYNDLLVFAATTRYGDGYLRKACVVTGEETLPFERG
jgi:hypothetical protein